MGVTTAATFCATLVDEWVAAGLSAAMVAPGSRSTPMALALAAHAGVEVHVFHDEQAPDAASIWAWTGEPRIERWLKALPRPVAILAANDAIGLRLSELCRQLRLAEGRKRFHDIGQRRRRVVAEQVGVCGFLFFASPRRGEVGARWRAG